jgi:hypothetical protein
VRFRVKSCVCHSGISCLIGSFSSPTATVSLNLPALMPYSFLPRNALSDVDVAVARFALAVPGVATLGMHAHHLTSILSIIVSHVSDAFARSLRSHMFLELRLVVALRSTTTAPFGSRFTN